MIWSRASKYQAEVSRLAGHLVDEQSAHRKTCAVLAAEVENAGRLHCELRDWQEAGATSPMVKKLTERLEQFTEQSVNSDLAVHDALVEHGKHHSCKRRPDGPAVPAEVVVEAVPVGGGPRWWLSRSRGSPRCRNPCHRR